MESSQFSDIQNAAKSYRPQNSLAFLHLSCDLFLVACAIKLASSTNIFLWIFGELLFFICLWRNFSLFHTAAHGSFFQGRLSNRVLGWYSSLLVMVPFESWKKSHLEHHRWAGSESKDPSLALPQSENISPAFEKFLNFCWKFHIPIFAGYVANLRHKDPKKLPTPSGLFVLIAHITLISVFRWEYVRVFALPYFLFLFTTDFLTISQHNLTNHDLSEADFPLPLHRHDEVTKELEFPEWVGRHVFSNFDLHLLHHMIPQTPHYYLRRVPYQNSQRENWWSWCKRVHQLPGKKVYLE